MMRKIVFNFVLICICSLLFVTGCSSEQNSTSILETVIETSSVVTSTTPETIRQTTASEIEITSDETMQSTITDDDSQIPEILNYISVEGEFEITDFIDDINIGDKVTLSKLITGDIYYTLYSEEIKLDCVSKEWSISDIETKEFSFCDIAIGDSFAQLKKQLESKGAISIDSSPDYSYSERGWSQVRFVPYDKTDLVIYIYLELINDEIVRLEVSNYNNAFYFCNNELLMLEAKANKSDWQDWKQEYLDLIKKNDVICTPNEMTSGTMSFSYLLKDLDNNGIPELVVSNQSSEELWPSSYAYTWNNGKLQAKEFGVNYIAVIEGENILHVIPIGSWLGSTSDAFWTVKGDGFSVVESGYYERTEDFSVEFYWNDNKVSAEEYQKNISKYTSLGIEQQPDMTAFETAKSIIDY